MKQESKMRPLKLYCSLLCHQCLPLLRGALYAYVWTTKNAWFSQNLSKQIQNTGSLSCIYQLRQICNAITAVQYQINNPLNHEYSAILCDHPHEKKNFAYDLPFITMFSTSPGWEPLEERLPWWECQYLAPEEQKILKNRVQLVEESLGSEWKSMAALFSYLPHSLPAISKNFCLVGDS